MRRDVVVSARADAGRSQVGAGGGRSHNGIVGAAPARSALRPSTYNGKIHLEERLLQLHS